MHVTHYDLFAGIGGFSYAIDTIFNDHRIEHIFCEWEAFPTAVLKQHWPDATYYGDIADLVADTRCAGLEEARASQPSAGCGRGHLTILTGGFPCQPFSVAGRRKGTADHRYLWPEMFAVIRNVRPDWVVAENVRGLATWNDGMVLETVCADLESEGYEVQPLVVPACAVGAPHRRDRIWIIAHAFNAGPRPAERTIAPPQNGLPAEHGTQDGAARLPERTDSDRQVAQSASDANERQTRPGTVAEPDEPQKLECRANGTGRWHTDWRDVAFATCHDGVDDGLPRWMDGTVISAVRHRKERLKACGNAIVPQVAMEIFRAIRQS